MEHDADSQSSQLEVALAQHHVSVENALTNLLAHSDARSQPGDLRRAFAVLDAELRDHLALEEHTLFPRLARTSPAEAARLQAEHDLIRDQLDELSSLLEREPLRANLLAEFVRLLRDHAAEESASLYEWSLDSLTEREAWPVLDWIRLRHASHSQPPAAPRPRRAMGMRTQNT